MARPLLASMTLWTCLVLSSIPLTHRQAPAKAIAQRAESISGPFSHNVGSKAKTEGTGASCSREYQTQAPLPSEGRQPSTLSQRSAQQTMGAKRTMNHIELQRDSQESIK
ncbi:hypothetical protein IE81DRAFT_109629 [Ceraceosorus guamensis]|uniref:Secreted protein n=1 Tax=Ceraceosorus guamensis TaxID=1522189 RepID=A0A316VZE0_9BASI|nr:hypothetical protein IE81DRAFT_109629 [Ceraceosorus guamensis]PWN42832.1 hypothetical protein IE81DRAFT_109629 [Ceraceosorus guamensis]